MELTKSDKKLCRKLMHIGIERECEKFVREMQKLSSKPIPLDELGAPYREENGFVVEGPWHKRYITQFRKVKNFDKHVARRYDGITGSHYLDCVLDLYYNDVITDDDIAPLSEEPRNYLMGYKQNFTP